MAITNFIPEVWSADLLVALEKSLVYGAPGVVNRDYEGDIAQYGDTVHITSLVDPTIGAYSPGSDITIEEVDDTRQTLLIDQSNYFAFEVDDIEARQARSDVLPEQARRAAYKLRDAADQYIAGVMAAGVDSDNVIGEGSISASEAYDLLVDLSVLLDESDVPSEGRFVVVTPKFHGLLLKDERFISAGDAAGASTRANGFIGEAAGLSVRKSNNAPDGEGDGKLIIAGSSMATTYAEQLVKVEPFRRELRFADGVKGLHLFGSRCTRPTALAVADVIV